jgi:hypothetical protein
MREAQREIQLVALRLGAVADSHQRQAPLEALRHADDHVRGERAQRSGHGIRLVRIIGCLERQRVSFFLDLHVSTQRLGQRSQRPLDRERLGRERRFDALGQGYRIFCDARHGWPTRRCR